MGYTHYWAQPATLPQRTWNQFMDVNRVLLAKLPALRANEYDDDGDTAPLVLVRESDDDSAPILDSEQLYCNGLGKWGHETFLLAREPYDRESFCKTARKPYDLFVCAVLINAVHYFGKRFVVASDGNAQDWHAAACYYQAVTERALPPNGPWMDGPVHSDSTYNRAIVG